MIWLTLLLLVLTHANIIHKIYVDARNGNDTNNGSVTHPLRTLPAARDLVRKKRSDGLVTAIEVLLLSGTYEQPFPLSFDSSDTGISDTARTTFKAATDASPRIIGGRLLNLTWSIAQGKGKNVWQANVPADIFSTNIPSLFVGGTRMWRARWPNVDSKFPTIWGQGYATASAGIGSIPCGFRSPDITIKGQSCALDNDRHYPAQPPRGLKFRADIAPDSFSKWSNITNAVVHVSTYTRPPDEGPAFTPGYVWIQNILQFTLKNIVLNSKTNLGLHELHFGSGGQQVNSYSWVLGAANVQNGSRFFVENIPQLLDAPGEWYYDGDAKGGVLYIIPPEGHTWDPRHTEVVLATAQQVIEIKGAGNRGVLSMGIDYPIQHLHFEGLHIGMTAPTFMELYEAPGRGGSDWTIHRGGAIFFEGAAHVSFINGSFSNIGGNAIFLSNAVHNISILRNKIKNIGESGICIMGDLLRSTGLGAMNFPLNIIVKGNNISEIGQYGKQTTGVFISVAGFITVANNVIHGGPSSGIKIDNGYVGGHQIIYNYIYDVVRETTDMGAVNTHNRDRFYVPSGGGNSEYSKTNTTSPWTSKFPMGLPRGPVHVDTIHPILVKGNLFETTCKIGVVGKPGAWWGVQNTVFCFDVDDGNVLYNITENVCKVDGTVGFKIGAYSDFIHITNNIVISAGKLGKVSTSHTPFSFNGLPKPNSNIISHNVAVQLAAEKPPYSWHTVNYCANSEEYMQTHPPPGYLDHNLYYAQGGYIDFCPNASAWQHAGMDRYSLWDIDPLLNTSTFQVDAGSRAFQIGFHNFHVGPSYQ